MLKTLFVVCGLCLVCGCKSNTADVQQRKITSNELVNQIESE